MSKTIQNKLFEKQAKRFARKELKHLKISYRNALIVAEDKSRKIREDYIYKVVTGAAGETNPAALQKEISEQYQKDVAQAKAKYEADLAKLAEKQAYIAEHGIENLHKIQQQQVQMAKGEVVISVRNLVVQFSVRNKILTAIRDVSLDIKRGETIAIVGESGSGKSVFTKTFAGMLEENGKVASGEIWYSGIDIAKFTKNEEWVNIRGKKIAMIFQDPMTSLNPLRRIGSQISEVIRLHRGLDRKAAKAEAIRLLKRVGIPQAEKRYRDYPFQYSGGMRQRVVIAIALACAPEILICDEPTTALDVTIQAQILKLINDLKEEFGFTVIFITHDLGVVAEVAERVAVMYAGQIIELGTVNDIYYDPRHPYTWALLSSLPQLGEKGERLYSIAGTPPSLFDKIYGDAFAPRSEHALAIDFEEEPPLFKISDTHYAKTWLLDPRAPQEQRPAIIGEISERVARIYSGDKENE